MLVNIKSKKSYFPKIVQRGFLLFFKTIDKKQKMHITQEQVTKILREMVKETQYFKNF